jgi:hypothetical protein
VKVMMASSPGHVGRPNEDFVGAVPRAMVLLDGAGIPGTGSVCRHGVAWYAHTLGASILGQLSLAAGEDLTTALADAIGHVAGHHRHTCDLPSPISPQAAVAILRRVEDRVDFLVLADVFVVLDSSTGEPHVITDPREVAVRRECSSVLDGIRQGTAEYERTRLRVTEAFRARRNQPRGYWVAKDDPHAAAQAVTGSVPLAQLDGAALLSNGASRVVDPYRLETWPAVMELLRVECPDVVLRRLREAEAGPPGRGSVRDSDPPDDATIAYCSPR